MTTPCDSAAFSPDGTRIVTASDDKTARIWDAATGKEIAVLRGQTAAVSSATFSPDGSRIVTASCGQDRAHLGRRDRQGDRGPATAMTARVLIPPPSAPTARASSPRHADKTARIWDAATGKEIAVLRGHDGSCTSAAFSPDGTRIVTASADKTARIWDAATGKEIAVLRGHETLREIPPPSAPTGRASSRRHGTRPRASGTPGRPGDRELARAAHETGWSAAFSPDGTRSSRRRRTRPRASGTPRRPARSRLCAGTNDELTVRRLQPRRHARRHRVRTTRPRASGTPTSGRGDRGCCAGTTAT